MGKVKSTSEPIAPIYAFSGAELFLRRQAMNETIVRALGNADPALVLSEYDGASGTVELATVLDDLRTLPFLAERRVVVVRDADKFITQHREHLEGYAANPSPTGVLVLECKSLPANTRLAKQIAKVGQLSKFEAMPNYKVPAWLTGWASSAYGVRMESQAAELLCSLIGFDLGLLDAELRKCGLYVGNRKRITQADIEALVGHHREEEVWGLLAAISARDEAKALAVWEQVWQTDRAAEARAIGGVAFTVRRLLKAKRMEEAGASLQDLGRELWQRDERRVRQELAAFTTAQVEEMICRLQEADAAAKVGLLSVRTSIERFVIAMCRRGRGYSAAG